MSAPIDCPICMDCIESTNCVTTECGHCFHTSCLMKSVAHNGFGCPYCRTIMAEAPEEDEETVWSDEEDEEEEVFDDDTLRGFRMFFNNVNGEPHEHEDEDEEQEMEEDTASVETEEDPSIPTTDFVAQKLKDQGFTFEQLVKIICEYDHDEYEDDEAAERLSSELFGKIRIIISNYTPEQATTQVPRVVVTPAPAPEVDFEAQPKTNSVRSTPRLNIHM